MTSGSGQQLGYDLAGCRENYAKRLRRYVRAREAGRGRAARELQHDLLDHPIARLLAARTALKKKNLKMKPTKFGLLVETLDCWERDYPPVRVHREEKPDGGDRMALDYGLLRAGQQYLVLPVLQAILPLHPGQCGVAGRDRTYAVEYSKRVLREGRNWVVRADIKDCFTSMDGKKVVAEVPLPETVKEVAIMAPPEEYITHSPEQASWVEKVRRGIPPGSAVSALVAAAALAPVLNVLPPGVVVVLYVDDFAIFASSKAEAEAARDALVEGLMASPAGNLQLKFCDIRHVSEGFGFLGYHILHDKQLGLVTRPRALAFEKLEQRIDAVADAPFEDKLGALIGWRCSHASWEGDQYGDDMLIAILGHHFGVGLEMIAQHAQHRAAKIREEAVARLPPSK